MVEAAVQLRPDAKSDVLNVVISGKLVDQRKHDGTFYSTLVAPAPDAYSSPMPFEVRSRKTLGSRDQVVSVPCRLGGFFRRTFDTTDRNTGEVRRVKPVIMTLDALEDEPGF